MNSWPLECHSSALPTELHPRCGHHSARISLPRQEKNISLPSLPHSRTAPQLIAPHRRRTRCPAARRLLPFSLTAERVCQALPANMDTPPKRGIHVRRQSLTNTFAISSLTLARLPRFGGVTMFAGRSRTNTFAISSLTLAPPAVRDVAEGRLSPNWKFGCS